MVANAISWPVAVLPRSSLWMPESQSRSGGQSILGQEKIVASTAGRWRARIGAPVVTENAVLSWRAFVASMNGRVGTVLMPRFEHYGPKDMNGKRLDYQEAAFWQNGQFDDDGLAFDLSGWGQDYSEANGTLAANAALGATQISVTWPEGVQGIRPGQYFGIGQRLYIAKQVWEVEEGDPSQVTFWPPLRAAASTGTVVIIDKPVCLMRFAQDATGELELDFGRWSQGGLELVEAW